MREVGVKAVPQVVMRPAAHFKLTHQVLGHVVLSRSAPPAPNSFMLIHDSLGVVLVAAAAINLLGDRYHRGTPYRHMEDE